jgi:hypothetical protein
MFFYKAAVAALALVVLDSNPPTSGIPAMFTKSKALILSPQFLFIFFAHFASTGMN